VGRHVGERGCGERSAVGERGRECERRNECERGAVRWRVGPEALTSHR
jgi:hypothetical protein